MWTMTPIPPPRSQHLVQHAILGPNLMLIWLSLVKIALQGEKIILGDVLGSIGK
jgi:hypothetical protein